MTRIYSAGHRSMLDGVGRRKGAGKALCLVTARCHALLGAHGHGAMVRLEG